MAKRRDEVEAAVHTVVLNVLTVEAAFVTKVLLKLLVNVVHNCPPAITMNNKWRLKNENEQMYLIFMLCFNKVTKTNLIISNYKTMTQ